MFTVDVKQQKQQPRELWYIRKKGFLFLENMVRNSAIRLVQNTYSRTSVARAPMGPWKLVRDVGSSSQRGLIIAPGQEAQ